MIVFSSSIQPIIRFLKRVREIVVTDVSNGESDAAFEHSAYLLAKGPVIKVHHANVDGPFMLDPQEKTVGDVLMLLNSL